MNTEISIYKLIAQYKCVNILIEINGYLQPDNAVAIFLALNNRQIHVFQSTVLGVYTT
jgi:hypothetical protein